MSVLIGLRSSTQTSGNSASISVPVPSGVQAGDLLVAVIATNGAPNTTITTPTGWTLIGHGSAPSGSFSSLWAFSRVAGSSEPTSYTFSGSTTTYTSAVMEAWQGVDSATPVDASAVGAGAASSTTIDAPSVNTSKDGAYVIGIYTENYGSVTITAPASMTVRQRVTAQVALVVADFRQATKGATGDLAATASAASQNVGMTVALRPANTAPNVPTVQVSSTIDSGASNVIAAPFSDPDAGDTCSQTDFQWWDLDNTGARTGTVHTQTVTGSQPTQWTAPGGTFTNGNKEIQAKSYDALGVASGWGPSAFFTAATPTGMPTITDPTNGATIGQTPYTVAWSTAGGQKGYRVRRVKDNAGSADATTVYWDSGQVTGAGADSVRSLSVPFETNGRYEHVQLRVTADGALWSAWADARVLVSYTPPAAPAFSVDLDPASGSALISVTNPAAANGEPAASYNIVETDDGDGKGFSTRPGSSQVAPNTSWRYWTPPSGFNPAATVRVTTVATNGTTSSTTSPVDVTSGGTPANTATTIYDGGTP